MDGGKGVLGIKHAGRVDDCLSRPALLFGRPAGQDAQVGQTPAPCPPPPDALLGQVGRERPIGRGQVGAGLEKVDERGMVEEGPPDIRRGPDPVPLPDRQPVHVGRLDVGLGDRHPVDKTRVVDLGGPESGRAPVRDPRGDDQGPILRNRRIYLSRPSPPAEVLRQVEDIKRELDRPEQSLTPEGFRVGPRMGVGKGEAVGMMPGKAGGDLGDKRDVRPR